MTTDHDLGRPTHYFALHYRLLRFLGLGWWHHPDEGNTSNFPGLYLYYAIITELVWVVGFVGLETIDPFIGEKDIDRFMFSLSFVITHDLTLIKLYIFFFKNQEIQDIVHTLEIDMYKYYQNNAKNRATVRTTKILTGAFLFFGWITIGNTNVYGTITDLRWRAEVANLNKTAPYPSRTLPQPIYIPWNYQTDATYIPTFVLETVGLLWTGHIVMTIDTFIGSVILHMSVQFSIMQEAITTAYDRTMEALLTSIPEDVNNNLTLTRNNAEIYENKEVKVRTFYSDKEIEYALETSLKSCIRQHQLLIRRYKKKQREMLYIHSQHKSNKGNLYLSEYDKLQYLRITGPIFYAAFFLGLFQYILQFTLILRTYVNINTVLNRFSCVEKFSNTYSYGFMTQLLSSMAAICVVMVQVSQDASSFKSIRLVTSLAYFVAMIIQLAIQCFTGNELTFQAEQVSTAVMHSKWERMPIRLRCWLILIMIRAQRPLRLTAAGFANMDNGCFLGILKAAYSYYAVLSQKQA